MNARPNKKYHQPVTIDLWHFGSVLKMLSPHLYPMD